MPGFDRTGPQGQGSRTGRQMGKCNPKKNSSEKGQQPTDSPEQGMGRGPVRSLGKRLGLGRRLGRGNE